MTKTDKFFDPSIKFAGKPYSVFTLFFLLGSLNSCTEFGSIGNNNELAAYAESVFRRQNSITSEIMMLSDDEIIDAEQLNQAESAMDEACHLLNEYSSLEMDGEPIGIFFKRKVRASIKSCDRSINKVEDILDNF